MIGVIETHPIQYHAPVYRILQERFQIPVTAIYGSDFSVAGYKDPEFETDFAWNTDLLSGYESVFLSRVVHGGARRSNQVSVRGLKEVLGKLAPRALLITGYSPRFNQLACVEAMRGGYPILFRGETTDHAQRRSYIKALLRDSALRWAYRRFAKLLYIGQRSYRHYKRLNCPEENLVFSPYCVDIDAFRYDEDSRRRLRVPTRATLDASGKDTILLFCGKLSPRKGPDVILRAVKHLPTELREKLLIVFVGSGSMS
ncbi:MAG: glycosyltransferase, partial [Deltaproteobacteria bacterium]|nr:glycosyltransferase [Deltaproteobacteria bacterium]